MDSVRKVDEEFQPSKAFVFTSALCPKAVERWAIGQGIPIEHVINSGKSIGDVSATCGDLVFAWRWIQQVYRREGVVEEVDRLVVVPGDSVVGGGDDVDDVMGRVVLGGGGSGLVGVGAEGEVVEGGGGTVRLLGGMVSPALYSIAGEEMGGLMETFAGDARGIGEIVTGVRGKVEVVKTGVFALNGGDGKIGEIPEDQRIQHSEHPPVDAIHCTAHARIGLMGNPSDGFFGRTVSVTIENFRAEAWAWSDPTKMAGAIRVLDHPVFDPFEFASEMELHAVASREGYSGGHRLMLATLYRFFGLLRSRGVARADKPLTLKYHTNIPRQVGLAGSSAIIVAVLRSLFAFYEIDMAAVLTPQTAPSFVLQIETEELGIQAGLQDRVAQWWGGAVAMDFAEVKEKGFGEYTRLNVDRLPRLFLAYCPDPSDSGKIHAPVKEKWTAGDPDIRRDMALVAEQAKNCALLLQNDALDAPARTAALVPLVRRNFDLRRAMFGDAALGKANLEMIELARAIGCEAKFTGSGGAVAGVVHPQGMRQAGIPIPEDASYDEQLRIATIAIRKHYADNGYVAIPITPHQP